MKNAQEPIHPIKNNEGRQFEGLTKREYFAGLALQAFGSQAIIPNGIVDDQHLRMCKESMKSILKASVEFADELLTQLEKKQ